MSSDEAPGADSDEELVARAREGDERAFGTLVDRYHAGVYRLALSLVSEGDVAQDVAQNAFLKAWRGLDGFRGDAAFRSWLFTIAANEARGWIRRRGKRKETALDGVAPPEAPGPDPEEDAMLAQEAARARRALESLPDKQRMSVSLRLDEGLSFREIGELIGSSEGAARVNYFHGIRRLRELMS